MIHVENARCLHDYVIWLRSNNGAGGEIDLESKLAREMLAPMKDLDAFRKFQVDAEFQTIVWENGADLTPEFLHENLTVPA
jgi:hypothetical protein